MLHRICFPQTHVSYRRSKQVVQKVQPQRFPKISLVSLNTYMHSLQTGFSALLKRNLISNFAVTDVFRQMKHTFLLTLFPVHSAQKKCPHSKARYSFCGRTASRQVPHIIATPVSEIFSTVFRLKSSISRRYNLLTSRMISILIWSNIGI